MIEIEEVARIISKKHGESTPCRVCLELAGEICQLFEPEPDSDRLLTEGETKSVRKEHRFLSKIPYGVLEKYLKAQRDLTASFYQANIEEIFKKIEDYIIESRRKWAEKLNTQKQIKPNDKVTQINIGGKLKAFQQVLNKVQSLKGRVSENDRERYSFN